MVCGQLPFDDDFIPVLFRKINEGKFIIPDFLSKEVADLLTSLLVVDPSKRYTIPEIRRNSWFAKV